MGLRTVDRVEAKTRLGPDAQVDDKAIIIMPNDPRRTDPFLALAEDWFSEPGFEWHPHRGIETVTTVLDGILEHGDNLGNAGALQPGDVQWMTAGRGIIHRELAFRNELAHTLQLWVNLPASKKWSTPTTRIFGPPIGRRSCHRASTLTSSPAPWEAWPAVR